MARQLVTLHRRVLRVDVSWRYLESGYAWLQASLRQTANKESSSLLPIQRESLSSRLLCRGADLAEVAMQSICRSEESLPHPRVPPPNPAHPTKQVVPLLAAMAGDYPENAPQADEDNIDLQKQSKGLPAPCICQAIPVFSQGFSLPFPLENLRCPCYGQTEHALPQSTQGSSQASTAPYSAAQLSRRTSSASQCFEPHHNNS